MPKHLRLDYLAPAAPAKGRRKALRNMAMDMLAKSCIRKATVIRCSDTDEGVRVEWVHVHPIEAPADALKIHTYKRYGDVNTEIIAEEPAPHSKVRGRSLWDGWQWVEFHGSDEAWEKLKRNW